MIEHGKPIAKRMTLVDFIGSLGPIQREPSYILLSQWERIAFLWFPHPGDQSGLETLVAAGWCSRDVLLGVPEVPVEVLRRARNRVWSLVNEKGCVEVTFHDSPTAIIARIPIAGVGWEPIDVLRVLVGEATLAEVQAETA